MRIRRRGGEGGILNSKSEFNRSHITRLTLPEKPPPTVVSGNQDPVEWELSTEGSGMEVVRSSKPTLSTQVKRQGETPRKNAKRMKYEVISDKWGIQGDVGVWEAPGDDSPSPHEVIDPHPLPQRTCGRLRGSRKVSPKTELLEIPCVRQIAKKVMRYRLGEISPSSLMLDPPPSPEGLPGPC